MAAMNARASLATLVAALGCLTARGETPAAFSRRCIPADCVAPPSHMDDMLGRRAATRGPRGAECAPWGGRAGRLAALGATLEFHHGLLSGTPVIAAQSPPAVTWTTAEDHQNMMAQLGIKRLRPGPSGNESAPNHANYDEAAANPFPDLPDPLTLKNGRPVTNGETWWRERRPEIVEDFEREVLGRVPRGVPRVTWRVADTSQWTMASRQVVGKQLVGHVDNASYP